MRSDNGGCGTRAIGRDHHTQGHIGMRPITTRVGGCLAIGTGIGATSTTITGGIEGGSATSIATSTTAIVTTTAASATGIATATEQGMIGAELYGSLRCECFTASSYSRVTNAE
jgi:hypothetical protein